MLGVDEGVGVSEGLVVGDEDAFADGVGLAKGAAPAMPFCRSGSMISQRSWSAIKKGFKSQLGSRPQTI